MAYADDMKQVVFPEERWSAPVHCQGCGGLMRLIGSEPHPTQDTADLLTYACTAFDEFVLLPLPAGVYLQL